MPVWPPAPVKGKGDTMGGFFVQSSHGEKGNFEVVVPRSGGGLGALVARQR
jgi:hypothetical protein